MVADLVQATILANAAITGAQDGGGRGRHGAARPGWKRPRGSASSSPTTSMPASRSWTGSPRSPPWRAHSPAPLEPGRRAEAAKARCSRRLQQLAMRPADQGQRRVKSVRLLPIVILAAVALLVFKGIGLVTNGGYVLLGTTTVEAAGGGRAPSEHRREADAMACGRRADDDRHRPDRR